MLLEAPASLDDELLSPGAEEPALLELEDGPPSGEVPPPVALVELGGSWVVVNGGLGGRVTSQPGRGGVVVVVEVDVGGVVVDVGGVVVTHGGVVGVVGVVDVGGFGFDGVFGGFGVFVLGVGFGGWLPIDGGPDASASVSSGKTGSDAIGLTPRAYASAHDSTVAT